MKPVFSHSARYGIFRSQMFILELPEKILHYHLLRSQDLIDLVCDTASRKYQYVVAREITDFNSI